MVDEKLKKRNPKAFINNSTVRARKDHARRLDLKTRKHHIPTVNKEQDLPPPMVVAIVGPPKSGKSTLLSSLIKHYTKSPVSQINGPITVVTGKRRRLTFFECNNDINSMVDLSKVADLALLLINAKDGLQMEIFEFLSMIQVAGFPKVMGVLTFLDKFKENKSLKVYKKKIKERFWTDVYPGAKVFYLMGFKYSSYGKREIINLARFISLAKPPQLSWRTTHPYIICDRMEDLTDPEKIRLSDNNCDRTVAFYGYVQGTHLKSSNKIHVMGVGDYTIDRIGFLPDPCPFPDNTKNRRLDTKEKLVYAPFSSINNILFDNDAVYIDVGQSQMFRNHTNDNHHTNNSIDEDITTPADNMYISAILDMKYSLKDKLKASTFKLTDNIEFEDENTSDNNEENCIQPKEETNNPIILYDDDDNTSNIDANRIRNSHQDIKLHLPHIILKQLIYGKQTDEQITIGSKKSEMLVGDLFFQKSAHQHADNNSSNPHIKSRFDNNLYDCTRVSNKYDPMSLMIDDKIDWSDVDSSKNKIYKYFITGQSENLDKTLQQQITNQHDNKISESINEDSVYGEFEDLEMTERSYSSDNDSDKHTTDNDHNSDSDNDHNSDSDNDHNSDDSSMSNEQSPSQTDDMLLQQKIEKKQIFDSEYDNKQLAKKSSINGVVNTVNAEKYTEQEEKYLNRLQKLAIDQKNLDDNEFKHLPNDQRVLYEGYRPGMYVRIEIMNIENEFVRNFNPKYPLIVGGLIAGEDQLGYLNCRIKKHKWYKRVLKNNDPIIVSLGWRRFQTIACYSMEDHNQRKRYIKYTPAHIHCYATCYGPITTPGVGVLTLQVPPYVRRREFHITTSGVTIEVDKSVSIVKKLKLIGTPYKIFKNTAFIKGMFSNTLEVTKFEGATITTVSGIRGHIKKAESSNDGNFRATFEDKILMSDIIFLKSWIPVELPQFYYPLKTLLLESGKRSEWLGMKTVGTLRYEQNLPYPNNPDSAYKKIQRNPRVFAPLVIPAKLQKDLPFKSKPKIIVKNANLPSDPTMVGRVLEPYEKKAVTLMKEILLSNKDINQKRALKRRAITAEFQQKKLKAEADRLKKIKETRKQRFKNMK